jgi:hypothetical protein
MADDGNGIAYSRIPSDNAPESMMKNVRWGATFGICNAPEPNAGCGNLFRRTLLPYFTGFTCPNLLVVNAVLH